MTQPCPFSTPPLYTIENGGNYELSYDVLVDFDKDLLERSDCIDTSAFICVNENPLLWSAYSLCLDFDVVERTNRGGLSATSLLYLKKGDLVEFFCYSTYYKRNIDGSRDRIETRRVIFPLTATGLPEMVFLRRLATVST